MVTYVDVSLGAGQIDGGLQRMGVTGKVYIALQTEDGERLENAFRAQARFDDIPLDNGLVTRRCTLNKIEFRWPKA